MMPRCVPVDAHPHNCGRRNRQRAPYHATVIPGRRARRLRTCSALAVRPNPSRRRHNATALASRSKIEKITRAPLAFVTMVAHCCGGTKRRSKSRNAPSPLGGVQRGGRCDAWRAFPALKSPRVLLTMGIAVLSCVPPEPPLRPLGGFVLRAASSCCAPSSDAPRATFFGAALRGRPRRLRARAPRRSATRSRCNFTVPLSGPGSRHSCSSQPTRPPPSVESLSGILRPPDLGTQAGPRNAGLGGCVAVAQNAPAALLCSFIAMSPSDRTGNAQRATETISRRAAGLL